MSIENSKLMNLADGQVLYNDLRGRVDTKVGDIAKLNEIINGSAGPASVVTFADGADGIPMELNIAVTPVQDLHGQEAPYPGVGERINCQFHITNLQKQKMMLQLLFMMMAV